MNHTDIWKQVWYAKDINLQETSMHANGNCDGQTWSIDACKWKYPCKCDQNIKETVLHGCEWSEIWSERKRLSMTRMHTKCDRMHIRWRVRVASWLAMYLGSKCTIIRVTTTNRYGPRSHESSCRRGRMYEEGHGVILMANLPSSNEGKYIYISPVVGWSPVPVVGGS